MTGHDWNAWVYRDRPGGPRLYAARCTCGKYLEDYNDHTFLTADMDEHLEETADA